MKISQTLAITSGEEFRQWLAEHHETAAEIWLLYPKEASGKPRIGYNDAVEVALCFGWIDSTVQRYDDETSAQRFTPRKAKSGYSQPNIERLRALRAAGLLTPQVLETVAPILAREFVFPADIIAVIRENERAWAHYQGFSASYRRIRVAFIESARKRPEEFQKRLRHFIAMTAKNKQFGFGGIEAHY